MNPETKPDTYGILAQFASPEDLIAAAEKIRDAGYRNTDAYTSFPLHGIHEALGLPKSRLALAVLIGGTLGALGGLYLQKWVSVNAYPHIVGGKPFFSWPNFVPIIFECTVLVAALTAFVVMLARNGLPRPHHPVFESSRFDAASSDAFFISIEATDPQFDEAATYEFVKGLSPVSIEKIANDEGAAQA